MKFCIGRQITAVWIDAESCSGTPCGDGVADLPGDGDGSNPRQCVGKIPEPFSEPNRRRLCVKRVGANALRARPTPFDTEAHRHHELMFGILKDAVFERGLQVLKSACSHRGRSTR